jgi:hypothetical protein
LRYKFGLCDVSSLYVKTVVTDVILLKYCMSNDEFLGPVFWALKLEEHSI